MLKKNKKIILGLVALGCSISLLAGIGVYAKYVQNIKSEDNIIKSKAFVVRSNGTLDESKKFSFTAQPGDTGEYKFTLDKSGVDKSIPVEYTITFKTDKDEANSLFNGNSPIELSLYRYNSKETNEEPILLERNKSELQWVVYPDENIDVDNFKLHWKWNENDATDINYQNKTGKITIDVKAKQMFVKKVDKSKLTLKINEAKALKEEDYKKDSWRNANLAQVLVKSEEILNNAKATQQEVDEQVKVIDTAVSKLQRKSPDLTQEVIKLNQGSKKGSTVFTLSNKQEGVTYYLAKYVSTSDDGPALNSEYKGDIAEKYNIKIEGESVLLENVAANSYCGLVAVKDGKIIGFHMEFIWHYYVR